MIFIDLECSYIINIRMPVNELDQMTNYLHVVTHDSNNSILKIPPIQKIKLRVPCNVLITNRIFL